MLVPLDGSPLSEAALEHALATFDCRITVLNVVTPVDGTMSESGVLEADSERRQSAREHAEDLLASARADATATTAERDIETLVASGEPAETILDVVDERAIDHVVMGGHGGDHPVARRLLGTVATAVVGEAPVTVTVVR